jgi:Smr domain
MKFSVGDKVLLRQTGEEGHVTAIIDKQMVEVDAGGTLFPVHIDDLDHPYLKWFTDKNAQKKKRSLPEQLPVEKASERPQRLARGIYLSFMPVFKFDGIEDVIESVKIYLLNELPMAVKFGYDVRLANKSEFRHDGVLHGFGNVYLHSISYAAMNDQPRFHWQLTDTTNEQMATADGVLRIRPAKLFEHISQLMQNNEPSFSYVLIEEFRAGKKQEDPDLWEPPAIKQKTVTTRTIDAARHEIDLHIEQLVDDTKGLSNAEMLHLQLDTLHRYVNLAIVHRQERMVVIHGLGKGRLREEVHTALKAIPEVSRFKNEWSGKYGFGATEIWFKY